MSGPSGREEPDRREDQPVQGTPDRRRFSVKGLFNWLAGALRLKDLFNSFARKRGPKPEPIKIDPAWFPVSDIGCDQSNNSDPEDFDERVFPDDHPDWDEGPSEPEVDTITPKPDERVPVDAGELLRTYYAPGIGDMRVYSRLCSDEMDIDRELIIEQYDLEPDEPEPESKPKAPK